MALSIVLVATGIPVPAFAEMADDVSDPTNSEVVLVDDGEGANETVATDAQAQSQAQPNDGQEETKTEVQTGDGEAIADQVEQEVEEEHQEPDPTGAEGSQTVDPNSSAQDGEASKQANENNGTKKQDMSDDGDDTTLDAVEGMPMPPSGFAAGQSEGHDGGMTVQSSSGFTLEDTASGAEITKYSGSAQDLVIPEYVDGKRIVSIGRGAFYECSSLRTVTLPSSVTTLGEGAFYGCSNLVSVSGGSYTALPDYVFGCTAMSTYSVPRRITSISSIAFYGTALQSFAVESGNTAFTAKNGVLFSNGGRTLLIYPIGKTDGSYSVPSGTVELAESSFLGVRYLRNVTIADSVTEAGSFTFYESSLESVTFGSGLKSTSYMMFEYCYNLANVDFGGLTALDGLTFAYCTSLQTIVLPARITYIGNGCFGCCYGLTTFSSSSLKVIPFQAFIGDYLLNKVNLNEGIETIYRATFLGCTDLMSVNLPNSCTFVHENAFEPTTVLHTNRTDIGKYGTNGLRFLDHVSIDRTRRYDYAFEVLRIVNSRRAEQGLGQLVMDESLLESAMTRAGECVALFAHTRPDGSFALSVNNAAYAENIAYGQTSASAAMASWMDSQGHRENILNEQYTTMGVGAVEYGGQLYWVQLFGKGTQGQNCAQPSNRGGRQQINLAVGTFDEATGNASGVVFSFGDDKSYEFKYEIGLNSPLKLNSTSQATLRVTNPGTSSTFTPAQDAVGWRSNNSAVASVDGRGRVTARKLGTATISASLGKSTCSKQVTVGSTPHISYRTHVQRIGWQKYVKDGAMSGTSGRSFRLEGINIKLSDLPVSGGIQYRTHVQKIGWQGWRKDGKMAGTSGKSYRLEAIEIKLYGEMAKQYDVYYRVHCQKFGWMGWAKNGQRSGSAGYSRRLEGIQIVLVKKGQSAPGNTFKGIKRNNWRAFVQRGKK